jgi:hypothetical protein
VNEYSHAGIAWAVPPKENASQNLCNAFTNKALTMFSDTSGEKKYAAEPSRTTRLVRICR